MDLDGLDLNSRSISELHRRLWLFTRANVFRNVTKTSFCKGIAFLVVLVAACGLDLTQRPTFGFMLPRIPLWCFGVLGAAGGILYFLGPMLFGSERPPSSIKANQPLILYLRPFELDARSVMQLTVGASIGIVVYVGLLEGIWWPTSFLPLIININKEQNFRDAFESFGEFIAFGKPNEWLQPIGASRVYERGDWERRVKDLMSQARVIIIRPGTSPSIQREMDHALNLDSPERLCFYLRFRGGKKRRDRSYQSFRTHLQSRAELPERLGRAKFLIFDRSWRPQFIEEANRPSQLVSQFFSRSGDISRDNLRPVLKALNLDLPARQNTLFDKIFTAGLWLIAIASVGLVMAAMTVGTLQVLVAFALYVLSQFSR